MAIADGVEPIKRAATRLRSRPAAAAGASPGATAARGTTAPKEKPRTRVKPVKQGLVKRQKFLPVTRAALIDRLSMANLWAKGDATEARRFFRYLDFWRHQAYMAKLMELDQTYEPFSPDSDTLITRQFTGEERLALQKQLMGQVRELLSHANFNELPRSQIATVSRGSIYGLDLQLDLSIFDELMVFYRGAETHTLARRNPRSLYVRKHFIEVPVFQRVCIVFKLKPTEVRVAEVMAQLKCERRRAERIVAGQQRTLPPGINADFVYMKLFKTIPHTDLEMVFPNTRIKFRTADKFKFGMAAGGGVGAGAFGAASKLAVAATPFGIVGAAAALGGVAVRQVANFIGQRNKYLMKMAQNLYFHALADNRGVLTLLADRAAEEDVKEEILLYSVLAKQAASVHDLDEIDAAIERYLKTTFGFDANYDIDEALKRLLADGIVQERVDGTFDTLPPALAAVHIDALWDAYLDNLPDTGPQLGHDIAPARAPLDIASN